MPSKSKGPKLCLHPNGNFYIHWSDGRGRSKRRSTGTSDSGLAQAILGRVLSEPSRPLPDAPKVSDVLAVYARDRLPNLVGKQTAELAIKKLNAELGERPAEALTRGELRGFYDDSVAPATRARQLTVLRAALNHARKEGIIEKVPAVPIAPHGPPRDRWLTKDEAKKLIRAADTPHLKLFIELALATAARSGAILDLTWDRVDLENSRIDLQPVSRLRTSKGRPVVPISPEMVQRLGYERIRANSAYVIEFRGKPVASIKTAFRKLAKRAGQPGVIPYTLRHTAATWMAQAGVPLAMIAGMMGQSIQRTTERYIKHHPDYLKGAMEALRLNLPVESS